MLHLHLQAVLQDLPDTLLAGAAAPVEDGTVFAQPLRTLLHDLTHTDDIEQLTLGTQGVTIVGLRV